MLISTVISIPPAMPSHMVAERITPALPHEYESAQQTAMGARVSTWWSLAAAGWAHAGMGRMLRQAPKQACPSPSPAAPQSARLWQTSMAVPAGLRTRGEEEPHVGLGGAVCADAAYRAARNVGAGNGELERAIAGGAAACEEGMADSSVGHMPVAGAWHDAWCGIAQCNMVACTECGSPCASLLERPQLKASPRVTSVAEL